MSDKINKLDRLALGTVQFGLPYGVANQSGQVNLEETRTILKHAETAGLDTLDTAIGYGESEQRLGEIGVHNWKIISKLPSVPDNCSDIKKWIKDSVKSSMARLQVKQLQGMLLHRPQDLLGEHGDKLYRELEMLKDVGLVEKTGVSIYNPEELDEISSNFKFNIVQFPFNIFDQRMKDSGWLDRLKNMNIEVHVRSVFLQGLLLMPPEKRPHKFNQWESLWTKWDKWLDENQITSLEACLRYVFSLPGIDKIIIGVDSLEQLKEIITASNGELPDIPASVQCSDADLVNPSRWSAL